ncbi:P-type ATPase [Mycolicibacterium grossiae]|uniref:Uncharacterized protein n=1 Tax=Mycolicibacterium grossiae TaxID=1552759 RepID=A0A1E8Q7Y4_9MYCO|nr:hypothetical protein [Mycolicibacterium grossiae]OFJ54597.1 hypothetical protein BEL07_06545 [Mycolicibacterium grossiae]
MLLHGASAVYQASESLPVEPDGRDGVFAGASNATGTLQLRVTRTVADTVIAVAMVADASASKALTQLFIEEAEQRYSVGMVIATIALLRVPLMLGADLQTTLLRATSSMIARLTASAR